MSSTSVQLGAAALSGTFLPWALGVFWKRVRRPDPKIEAEARKLNAEADETIVNRLYREILRLDDEMKELRAELIAVKETAVDEKRALEERNRLLRNRVANLEKQLDQQRIDFEHKLADERDDCAKKLADMEGHIRQLQQRQASYGHLIDKPLAGPLRKAFPPDEGDKDADLIEKLRQVPGRKGAKK